MKIIEEIEKTRQKVSLNNEIYKQKLYEQYFTPLDITKYMSNLFSDGNNLKILDKSVQYKLSFIIKSYGFITLRYLMEKNRYTLNMQQQ